MISLPHVAYMFQKPFHSAVHKSIKRKASGLAASRGLYDKALAELVEYTRESAAEIESKYRTLPAQLNQQDFDRLTDAQLQEFYAHDRHYLYELPLWNAGSGRVYYFCEVVFPYIRRHGYSRILDFGGGSGDLCIGLTEYGFAASYYDINSELADFSRWRFKKRNLAIPIIDQAALAGSAFDCIVSFDVFEHLKNLPEKIKSLAASIRQGGSLIFNIEFSGEGLHLAENKMFADFSRMDKALNAAGLVFNGKFKMFFFYKKI